MRKTFVYIDGFNLYYRLKGTPYKWINPLALCKEYLPSNEFEIVEIKFFTAKIKNRNQNDIKNQVRQEIYWRALNTIPILKRINGKYKRKK